MENKSVEILNKLKGYLEKGSLSTNAFPKEDIIEMICGEYKQWLNKRLSELVEYAQTYYLFMDDAINENDPVELSGLIDELIDDLQMIPEENLDKMNKLRDKRTSLVMKQYKRQARAAYNAHPFNAAGKRSFQGKGVIYTVITGNYDALSEPRYVSPEFDYICFTDNKELSSEIWSMRYIENPERLDNVRLARKHKILCHDFLPEYDYSVYVDGKIQMIGDINEYIEKYSKGRPMLCFPHYIRECAYEEAGACIEAGKDLSEIITKQMDEYRQEGYPAHYGLIDSACMVRCHHDEQLQRVMNDWWKEVREKSRRDQLSIGYACWKNDFQYDLCDLFTYGNEYLGFKGHQI